MKFVTVRDFRSKPTKVWEDLKKSEEMVLTSNGKPIALLNAVTEDNLEETISVIRKAKAMTAALAIQTRSVDKRTNKISLGDINKEIAAGRKNR